MADGDSIGGILKDLGKETVKQIATVPKSLVTDAASQVVNTNSEEIEAKKKAEKAATHQRILQVEAEMKQLASQNSQKKGPEIPSSDSHQMNDLKTGERDKKPDEASRQALGRAEQGRNFKG